MARVVPTIPVIPSSRWQTPVDLPEARIIVARRWVASRLSKLFYWRTAALVQSLEIDIRMEVSVIGDVKSADPDVSMVSLNHPALLSTLKDSEGIDKSSTPWPPPTNVMWVGMLAFFMLSVSIFCTNSTGGHFLLFNSSGADQLHQKPTIKFPHLSTHTACLTCRHHLYI